MPKMTKLGYITGMVIFVLGTYVAIQTAVTTHKFDFLTSFDMAIPFMPEFVWIYHSLLPGITLTMLLLVKTRHLFLNIFWACLVAALVLNVSYVAFPSFYPRADFPVTNIHEALVEWTRQIDGSNNTFPSGHVTFAWLMFIGAFQSMIARKTPGLRSLYLLWAIGISLSTLVLKQHYIVDVISGISLAFAAYYISKPIVRLHMRLVTNDGSGKKITAQST